MISAQEIINNKTPDLEELKQREKGFIFFEEQLLTKISKEEFVKKYQVVLVDDLATIGEDNLNNKSVADNEDVILVRGKTAYPGFVKGRVRIIMLKSQLDTIQDGEILVTNMTTPEFVPALKKVVAFITDEGGITSHAAIVAREMRKPCIIGTKNATKKLKDGDLVEVDANNGIVKILRSRSVMALDAGLKSVAVKYIKEFARNYSLFHVVAFVEFNKRPTPEFNIIIDTGHPLFVHTGGSLANIYYPEGELRKIFDQFGKVIMANTGYLDGVIAKFFKVIDEIRPYFEKKKSVKNLEELKYLYELFMDFGYGEALVWVAPLVESLPDETKAKALSVREQTQDLTSLRDEAFDYNLCKLFPELGELTHFVLPKSVFSGKTVGELLREAKRYQKGFIYFNGNIYTGRQDKILKKLNIELESDKPTEKIYSISGQSASSGLARGKVKIVLTNKDLAKILDGDILVSPMTRPDFLPAMKKAAAFVTDEGGVTCHAAIVSREMSKPCIIGTKVATQVLKDGDSVEVDANIGVVKILK